MAQNGKIEWTHHTANLWHGCTKVHAGCDHCYAETLSKRWGHNVWGNDNSRKPVKSFLKDIFKYQKLASAAGEMHRVFVGSMMDIFEKAMPLQPNEKTGEHLIMNTGDLRGSFFQMISDGLFPNLVFLMLTKRPSNINKIIPSEWKVNPPANVMFGCSISDQETADKLILQLMDVNGKLFLSIEPQLHKILLPDCIWKV